MHHVVYKSGRHLDFATSILYQLNVGYCFALSTELSMLYHNTFAYSNHISATLSAYYIRDQYR
jgi:hypothetical protein